MAVKAKHLFEPCAVLSPLTFNLSLFDFLVLNCPQAFSHPYACIFQLSQPTKSSQYFL